MDAVPLPVAVASAVHRRGAPPVSDLCVLCSEPGTYRMGRCAVLCDECLWEIRDQTRADPDGARHRGPHTAPTTVSEEETSEL